MTVISLRSATRADDEFCYQLHKAAMGGYVAAVWGWDEQVQREYHARAFKPRRWKIITVNGANAGILSVEYRPDEVYLARIEIRPSVQAGASALASSTRCSPRPASGARTWCSTFSS